VRFGGAAPCTVSLNGVLLSVGGDVHDQDLIAVLVDLDALADVVIRNRTPATSKLKVRWSPATGATGREQSELRVAQQLQTDLPQLIDQLSTGRDQVPQLPSIGANRFGQSSCNHDQFYSRAAAQGRRGGGRI
jgi:hypothetical protein